MPAFALCLSVQLRAASMNIRVHSWFHFPESQKRYKFSQQAATDRPLETRPLLDCKVQHRAGAGVLDYLGVETVEPVGDLPGFFLAAGVSGVA